MQSVLGTYSEAAAALLDLVEHLKEHRTQRSVSAHCSTPSQRCSAALCSVAACHRTIGQDSHVILLWWTAEQFTGWCSVPEIRPEAEQLPLVWREGMLLP